MKRTPRAPSSTVGNCPRAGRARGPPASRGSPRRRRGRRWRTPRDSPPGGPAGCASPSAPPPRGSRCRAAGAGRAVRRRVHEQVRILLAPVRASPRCRAREMRRLFSFPISICDATSSPRTPPSRRSSTAASSSSRRPGTTVARSAQTLRDVPARDRRGEVLGVRADVAHRAGDARARRVGAPRGLLVPGRLEPRREPALAVLDDDLAQLAQLAARDHVARVPDERVAGVVVGDAEHGALARHERRPARSPARSSVHERLVAHDVEAGLDERLRDREVHVVRRHDRRRSRCGRPRAARARRSSISCHEP